MHRTVERMLRTNPEPPFAPLDPLSRAIHAAIECAQVCAACADACVGEHVPNGGLDHCIRLTQDCADICTMASRVLTRQQSPDLALIAMTIELCAYACESCAAECERHAIHHAHCYVCAAACRRCFTACRELMQGDRDENTMH